MKRIWSILALGAAVGLIGCSETESGISSDQQNMDQPERVANNPPGNYNNSFRVGGSGSSYSNTDLKQSTGNLTPDTQPGNSDISAGPQLNSGSDKTKLSAALSQFDRSFMQSAAAGGMYELQAGQKALAKSSDQRVKDIAQHLVDDHTKANQQLEALARRKGVELSSLPNGDQIKMLSQLDSASDTDFDREYLSQQRQAHQDAIAAFQVEARDGTDRDTRDWAAAILPTLRDHLRMVEDYAKPALGRE